MKINRVIISGASSGVGKTTVTNAILSLVEEVTPFKIGPDFIDPMLHQYVTSLPSTNLDSFIYDEHTIKYLFKKYSGKINILEGVMGLYDGLNHSLENNSTAQMSRILDCPVILVIDGEKKATSLAAHVKGLIGFDPRVNIAGVILNRTTKGSYQYLKSAIEQHCDVKCLGYLEKDTELKIKERHLGLLQANEIEGLDQKLDVLKSKAKETLDLEAIIKIANGAPEFSEADETQFKLPKFLMGKTVAYAKDEAFSFIYNTHVDLFNEVGATVKYFSPIHDTKLPKADFYIFPGGYPELYLKQLTANNKMMISIQEAVSSGAQILAECGGFIYLSHGIEYQNEFYKLCDIYDIDIKFTGKLDFKRFGYINVNHDGQDVKGHEFHYSSIKESREDNAVYHITNKHYTCGYQKNNSIAGYPHLLYYSNLTYFKRLFGEKHE